MVDQDAKSQVELWLSAKNIPDMDTFSLSDPMCVVSMKDSKTGLFMKIGQTECIQNNLNPEWKKRFVVNYFFEEVQEILFEVYDIDSDSPDLSKQDYIGYVRIMLSEVVAAKGQSITTALKRKDGKPAHGPKGIASTFTVRLEELQQNSEMAKIELTGTKLDKMDWFGKSDPFIEFFRVREDGFEVSIYKTEVIKNTLNPRWAPFSISMSQLCNGDKKREIIAKCFDWNSSGKTSYIGQFRFNVQELLDSKGKPEFTLTHPNAKSAKDKTKSHGTITFVSFQLRREYSFLDYIRGGMSISLMVAVDFTGSNGDPSDPSSLHYRFGSAPNEYVQAITSIGNILAPYDSDQNFPIWGFGGKIRGQVSHCFPLTFNPDNIEVRGVAGLLDAYHNAFKNVLLSGPTYFSEVITTASSIASRPFSASSQHFSILLIITDGVIQDMDRTIEAIVAASSLPMSIIIVGVGSADFKNMEILDADDVPLQTKAGKKMARDIVQFVPFSKFKGQSATRLAAETLAEVPGQVLDYARLVNVLPGKPREAKEEELYQPSAVYNPYADPSAAAQAGLGRMASAQLLGQQLPSFRQLPSAQPQVYQPVQPVAGYQQPQAYGGPGGSFMMSGGAASGPAMAIPMGGPSGGPAPMHWGSSYGGGAMGAPVYAVPQASGGGGGEFVTQPVYGGYGGAPAAGYGQPPGGAPASYGQPPGGAYYSASAPSAPGGPI